MTLTVFYNTLCPVCKAGITRYERRMIELVKSGLIEYRNINLEPDRFADQGIDVEDIRKKLHALKDGNLIVGADVVLAIWKMMPSYRWLGRVMSTPPLLQLMRMSYHILAQVLYFWNRRKGNW